MSDPIPQPDSALRPDPDPAPVRACGVCGACGPSPSGVPDAKGGPAFAAGSPRGVAATKARFLGHHGVEL